MKHPSKPGGNSVGRGTALFAVSIALLFILSACGSNGGPAIRDDVTVRLQWFHESQFAGFYAAEAEGLYKGEGLSVALVPIDKPGEDIIGPIIDGRADFGTARAGVLIEAREQGQEVVAIAVVFRRDPLVFFTLADSGIERLQDFPGRTINTFPGSYSEALLEPMMESVGLDPNTVEQVPAGPGLDQFKNGDIDIWFGYLTSQVVELQNEGIEVNLILPSDYGLYTYGDTIFTSERLINEEPELVTRFLRATLAGWTWAVGHPNEAGLLPLNYDAELDATAQIAQLLSTVPLVHTGQDELGWMDLETWEGMVELYLELGLIQDPPAAESLFNTEFLDAIYPN